MGPPNISWNLLVNPPQELVLPSRLRPGTRTLLLSYLNGYIQQYLDDQYLADIVEKITILKMVESYSYRIIVRFHTGGFIVYDVPQKMIVQSSDFSELGKMISAGIIKGYEDTLGAQISNSLAKIFPVLGIRMALPCFCALNSRPLFNIIMHMNDFHRWSREVIASYIESLKDLDITMVSGSIGD